jgi:hypothetical protein
MLNIAGDWTAGDLTGEWSTAADKLDAGAVDELTYNKHTLAGD